MKSFTGSKVLTRNKNNLKQRFTDTKALVVLKIKSLSEEPHSWLSDDAFLQFNYIRERENGCILVMIKTRSCKFNSLCFCFCLKTNCDFVIRMFPVNQGILLANKSQCIWNTLRRMATMQKIGQLVRPARATIIIDLRFSEQDSRNSLLQTGNITNSCLQNWP